LNKVTRLILLLILVFELAYTQSNTAISYGSPFITNYTDNEYLEQGRNWAIEQGKDGRLYFANNYRVLAFNGYDWEVVVHPANLSELRSLHIHQEQAYVGAVAEIGVFPLSTPEKGYQSLNHLITDKDFQFNDVWEILSIEDKVVFLADNGTLIWDQDSVKVLDHVFHAATKGQEDIVFASNNGGLLRYSKNQWDTIATNIFQNLSVEFLLAIAEDTYLIGTQSNGMLLYKNGALTVWNETQQTFFKRHYLTEGIILNKDQLLFGSFHNGIIITDYNGNILNIINEKDGLLDSNILSLYKDEQGNIWTSQDGSFAYVELNSPFTIYNKKHGLHGVVYAILKHQDQLYVGTNRGLYVANWKADTNQEIIFELIPNTTGQVWQLFEHQGNLLMAHHNGIFEIKDRQANYIGGEGHWNFAVLPNQKNLLLTGHYKGIKLLEKTASGYQLRQQIEGFTETARELVIEDSASIWISQGYQGIYKLALQKDHKKFSEVQLYDQQNGLPSNLFNNVITTDKGVYFGTQNGVYQYNRSSDQMELNSAFKNSVDTSTLVRKLFQTPAGNYLAIRGYEEDYVELVEILEDGSFTTQTTPFQKLDGQFVAAFEPVYFLGEETILIGSVQGLVSYDATFNTDIKTDHQCYIHEVALPNRDSILQRNIQANATVSRAAIETQVNELLRFSFSSSFFEQQDATEFSTYLEGYDDQWLDWNATPQRDFIDLPIGDYTFWVKAKNIYEAESPSVAFPFSIQSSSQQSSNWWITSLLGLLAALLGYRLSQFRNSDLTERSNTINNLLKEEKKKSQKLESKKKKLSKEKDLINKKLTGVLLENEVYSSLFKKINQLPKNQLKGTDLENALQEFQASFQEADMQLVAHQTIESEDFLSKLKTTYPDLSPRELRLCSYLKLNISSKEIAEHLGISIRGVESLRYRLRKKLSLQKGQDLTAFILNYK